MLSDGSADAPLESIGATDSPAPDVLVVPPLLHATSAALSARNRTIRLIMWSPPKGISARRGSGRRRGGPSVGHLDRTCGDASRVTRSPPRLVAGGSQSGMVRQRPAQASL